MNESKSNIGALVLVVMWLIFILRIVLGLP